MACKRVTLRPTAHSSLTATVTVAGHLVYTIFILQVTMLKNYHARMSPTYSKKESIAGEVKSHFQDIEASHRAGVWIEANARASIPIPLASQHKKN